MRPALKKSLDTYAAECGARQPQDGLYSCKLAPNGSMIWSPIGKDRVYCTDCIHYRRKP